MLPVDRNRHAVFNGFRFDVNRELAERVLARILRFKTSDEAEWQRFARDQIAAAISAARQERRR